MNINQIDSDSTKEILDSPYEKEMFSQWIMKQDRFGDMDEDDIHKFCIACYYLGKGRIEYEDGSGRYEELDMPYAGHIMTTGNYAYIFRDKFMEIINRPENQCGISLDFFIKEAYDNTVAEIDWMKD